MNFRLLKLRLPAEHRDEVEEIFESHELIERWNESVTDGAIVLNALLEADKTEGLVSSLEEAFGDDELFRVVMISAEATVPMPEPQEAEASEETSNTGTGKDEDEAEPPINIEELYADVTDGIEISWHYLLVAVLSAIVASVGIVREDVAIVIAAMIIAPLLSPNISLSLATTLADGELAIRSLKVNILGLGASLAIAFLFGMVFPVDPESTQIVLRTKVGIPELILAASAGAAGALSFTTGAADRLTGVMIAVALLPPVVIVGMLGGAGYWSKALGALYLVASNIICLNLAGVVTFFVQRIRPRAAWEAERAKRSLWIAIGIWVVLLTVLIGLVVASGAYRPT